MKKFWKVYNNSDIKFCLEYLNIDPKYIDILLESDSDFMEQLQRLGYAYIGYNDNNKDLLLTKQGDNIFKGFGWCEDDNFYLNRGYTYCGDINLRKEKLLKLNERFN